VIDARHYFDLPRALLLASAADLAYLPPAEIEQTAIGKWNFTQLNVFDVEDTQCFLTADQDSILVAFRGTEASQLTDWISDLDFDLVAGPWGGRVHEGFYDALSCIWHLLDREVRQLHADRPRQLWVTGHSLGAALAILAVARWLEAGRPVAGLYAFGQPRTGDSTFARNFDFAFRPHAFRIVNHHDIVTRTPPRSLGYQHLGTLIYLTDAGELSHDVSWWQQFLNGWNGAIEALLDWGREGLADHRMASYCQRLEVAGQHRTKQVRDARLLGIGSGEADSMPARIRPRRRAA
jgi:triacylglycerol lipase